MSPRVRVISTLVTPTFVYWTYPETDLHKHVDERGRSQVAGVLGDVSLGLVRLDRSSVRVAGDHR